MWIHEGWATYLESLYVEHMFGYDDALKYVNGYKTKIRNTRADHHASAASTATPPQDMYFKGALFLNTLRSVVNDDARWWRLLRDCLPAVQVPEHHDRGHRRVLQPAARQDLTPIFDQYLRRVDAAGARADVQRRRRHASRIAGRRTSAAFAMPIRVGTSRQVADHPADDRLADDEDAADAKRRSRSRPTSITST